MCKGKIASWIVHILTLAIWLCGVLLIIFGSIALSDPNSAVNMLSVTKGTNYIAKIMDINPLIEGVAIFMIVLGCILFVFGGLGCHGVATEAKISLMLFWLTLIGAILVEVALIIYASVYPGNMVDHIQKEMNASLVTYYQPVTIAANGIDITLAADDTEANAWQQFQFQTHCCGVGNTEYNGHQDFVSLGISPRLNYNISIGGGVPTIFRATKVPLSCCKTTNEDTGNTPSKTTEFVNVTRCFNEEKDYYWEQSCWVGVKEMMYQFNYISIILCSCLIGAEMVAILFSIRMWNAMG